MIHDLRSTMVLVRLNKGNEVKRSRTMDQQIAMSLLALTAAAGLVNVVEAEYLGLVKKVTLTSLDGTPAYVTRIYARFSCPEDRVLAVEEADINSSWSLYQNPFGTATEPIPQLVKAFPSLALDSFVTIGLEQQALGQPTTSLQPGSVMSFSGFTGGYFTDPTAPQTLGQLTPELGGGAYFVLLGQFTIANDDVTFVCVEGTLTVRWLDIDGQEFQSFDEFSCPITSFPPPYDADLNNDGLINGVDLAILLGNWGACPGPESCSSLGDLFPDSVIGGGDLAILLGLWGPPTDCSPRR